MCDQTDFHQITEAEMGPKSISVNTSREYSQGEVTSPLIPNLKIDELLCGLTGPCQRHDSKMIIYESKIV